MKKYFLLPVLLGASANAATMCVPDLSACESCTNAYGEGALFKANCCGVDIAGVGIYGDTHVMPGDTLPVKDLIASVRAYCACLIIYPVVSEKVLIKDYDYDCGDACVLDINNVLAVFD